MKIEVEKVVSERTWPKRKTVVRWTWFTYAGGILTASGRIYGRKSDAVRGAVNHGMAFLKVIGVANFPKKDRAAIRAAIKVIE